ncbi:DUF222 domain-containing protein, partial [Mycobacterium sp. IS-1496]|uniref:DUF222 domain-containing protein n=1 Tax=Mycobacterium sp. IS-1496 TaxID=1772284 RepID=UPI0012F8B901
MFDGSLPETGDMPALSDAELVAAAAGWGRVESAAAARKLAAMAEVFRRRTGLDHADDRNNWFVDPETSVISELAATQNITETLAMFQTHRAVMLGDRLPKVAALFEAGQINDLLVRAIVTRTALITDPATIAAVDTALADQITTWGPKSKKKTAAAIDAVVESHDPAALRRTQAAEQDRDIEFGFMGDAAGFMTVWARMYAPDGAAFEQRVHDAARTLCPDDPRSPKERRNDALAAIATGTTLRCECDNPDCPAATTDARPTKDVVMHVITTQDTLSQAQDLSAAGDSTAEAAGDDAPESDAEPEPEHEVQPEPEPEAATDNTAPKSASAPRQSACPAPAFVFGAGVTNPTVLAAFLDRATIRPIIHPGDAPPEPRYRPST